MSAFGLFVTTVVAAAALAGAGDAMGSGAMRLRSVAADTQEVRPLPSGFSYRELLGTLATLRPIAGGGRAGAGEEGTTDGLARREIGGLVVDETATKIGRDFYEVFFSGWKAPAGVVNYTIRIQELPSLGLGSRVVLFLNDEALFQLQLQPRYELVEALAQRAAFLTRQELERRSPAAVSGAGGERANRDSRNQGEAR